MVSPFQNSDVLQGCQHYSNGLTFMERFLCAKHYFFSCNFHTNCSSYIFVPIHHIGGLPSSLVVKNPPANAGDARDRGSISGSVRFPGGGHGNPLQYSWPENLMDRGAWQARVHRVTQSQTRLKQHICICTYHMGRASQVAQW